jgi:hypothetical protein
MQSLGRRKEDSSPKPGADESMEVGAPSKKKDGGTFRVLEICCRRLAPIRLVPFSYF